MRLGFKKWLIILLGFRNLREGFSEDKEGDAERDKALKKRQIKWKLRKSYEKPDM